ncbi:response regulator, partial [Coprococcus eutactus]|uniref:response regulator n=1 Tax=Coprococcus eutactus TaxID=33043 RepID=UPI00210B3F4E
AEHYPEFSVFTASCFKEATAIIDSSKFDLFMLDINLGDGNSGLDVCSYLRRKPELKDTPVVFITDVSIPSL